MSTKILLSHWWTKMS